nr:DbpA RNA binding domain-containing protein [Deltaproteobacteria bacterium]
VPKPGPAVATHDRYIPERTERSTRHAAHPAHAPHASTREQPVDDVVAPVESQPAEPRRAPAPKVADDGAVWFTINVGRSKNADPKWLVPLLCRRGGVTKRDIGKIQILARETRVEIAGNASERFAEAIRQPDPKDRNIHIEPLDLAP